MRQKTREATRIYCPKCGRLTNLESTRKCKCGFSFIAWIGNQIREGYFPSNETLDWSPGGNDWPEDRQRIRDLMREKSNSFKPKIPPV